MPGETGGSDTSCDMRQIPSPIDIGSLIGCWNTARIERQHSGCLRHVGAIGIQTTPAARRTKEKCRGDHIHPQLSSPGPGDPGKLDKCSEEDARKAQEGTTSAASRF